jgi:hypothetical protein
MRGMQIFHVDHPCRLEGSTPLGDDRTSTGGGRRSGEWAVRVREGTWELGTGGRITVRSAPHEEHAESRWKAQRLLRVFE